MKVFAKTNLRIALLFVFSVVLSGGVYATDYYGELPSCISNFKYDDYSIFVGKKHVKFTWTVTNASEAAKYKLYYYVADERTLYDGSNDKGNDSWSQLRMYCYGTRYHWNYGGKHYYKRFSHIDQGPWAKSGLSYSGLLGDNPDRYALDPTSDGTTTTAIGTVTSMNPLLVGRSIKWDDPTTFANGEAVVKKVDLTAGGIDFGEINGKSLCVFFMIHNTETGDNYYGPDKQTNSTDAGKRHFSYSILPWNGCWMSVNLCVPMPIKVSWSSTEDDEYTEVPCGTDVEFPGDDVWVKLEPNTAFTLGDGVSGSEDIWYNTSSLLPVRVNHNGDGQNIDNYDEYYIESKLYSGPIHLERNTVLRYSLWNGDNLKYGQVHTSGFATMGKNSDFDEASAYSMLEDTISFTYPAYSVYPIYTNLRKHYMWGNTFVKKSTETIDLTFTKSVPYSSWVEYLTGRYGLGSGTYTYQTYVPDRDLLIPSSLEGILDFFIILYGKSEEITGQEKGQHEYGPLASPYMSRVNWVPKGMPVIVRYRNYSKANPMETPAEAATNMASLKRQLTGESLGTENEKLPGYFLNEDLISKYSTFGNNQNLKEEFYLNTFGRSFKNMNRHSLGDITENIGLNEPYYDPIKGEAVYFKYPQKTDSEGNPLYQSYTKNDKNGNPGYQLLDDDGKPLYEVLTDDGEKLYFYGITDVPGLSDLEGNPYQITDENGKRLWMLADENNEFKRYVVDGDGKRLYHYKDGNGNKVYYKYVDNDRIYQAVDDEGKALYYKVNTSGEKLYYEYYTEEGSSEKKHLYLVTDNDGNANVYQKVNANNERLYYAYDENGNPQYQKLNENNEPLYYKPFYVGSWVKAVKVVNAAGDINYEMPESAYDPSGAQSGTNKEYIPITESELGDISGYPPYETIPLWPFPAGENDRKGDALTTTTPNTHPVIDDSSTSGYLAYTTEQMDGTSVRPYATTTTEGEWVATITADDAEYSEYVANNTLLPVETTDVTAYPILQTSMPSDYPLVGASDAVSISSYTVDTTDPYLIGEWHYMPTDYASLYQVSIPVTITSDDPSFDFYWQNSRIAVYATDDASLGYPPYCGRIGYDEHGVNLDAGPQNEQTSENNPVLISTPSLEGYRVEPAVWDPNANLYYNEANKGDLLNNDYPVYDYDNGPLQRTWATDGFIDINDFDNPLVSDYASNMDPQTFKVYDGTTDRAYWFPQYHCYHLSSLDHRDEGNFHNALCNVTVPTSVLDLEENEKYAVFGLSIDHTNEWVGANVERSSGDTHTDYHGDGGTSGKRSSERLQEGGVETNDDIGLHLAAFTKKYSEVLTDSARQAPILDDWLIYAGDNEASIYQYPYNNIDDGDLCIFDFKPFPFYYGFFLRDHTIESVAGEYSNDGYDFRKSLASAAWRRVNPYSSNKIQPGKVFLLYDWNMASFSIWYDETAAHEREVNANTAKMEIISGTTLSPVYSFPWSAFESTGIKSSTTNDIGGEKDGSVYDLQGRKVTTVGTQSTNHLPKGVYIRDGKKFVVK
ncbi:MAG: hypothetical protein J6N73_07155 [Prevotella sp.]|nr:hypothetical protein [Prevotella sp.]